MRPPRSGAGGERERGVGSDVWSDFEDDLSVWLERDVPRWAVPVLSADVDSYACVVWRPEWPRQVGDRGCFGLGGQRNTWCECGISVGRAKRRARCVGHGRLIGAVSSIGVMLRAET